MTVTIAELRTIALCDSTLSIRNNSDRHLSGYLPSSPSDTVVNYTVPKEKHNKSSSVRSIYDNVDNEDTLLPSRPLKYSTDVTRSKSFQEPSMQRYKFLSPFDNQLTHSRFYVTRVHSDGDAFSMTSTISPASSVIQKYEPSLSVPVLNIVSDSDSSDRNSSRCKNKSHLLGRIYRRMRKISLSWRNPSRCRTHRGDSFI